MPVIYRHSRLVLGFVVQDMPAKMFPFSLTIVRAVSVDATKISECANWSAFARDSKSCTMGSTPVDENT